MIRNDQKLKFRKGCPHNMYGDECSIQDRRSRTYFVTKGKARLASVEIATCKGTFTCPIAYGQVMQDHPRCLEVYL